MERAQTTGWRRPGPAVSHVELRKAEKNDLYEAQRLVVKIFALKPAARFVLEQLVTFYRGEPIAGRALVWPSNELIGDRTGLSERAIRYSLRALIELGIITSKDSPNGKRYARKSAQGQIIDAFGFDLSPLQERLDEFRQRIVAIKDLERERKSQFDEMTVCRRQIQELLKAVPDDSIERELASLAALTPRRGSLGAVDPILRSWRSLLEAMQSRYNAAYGGNECLHKDTNNDSPDQSCYNGLEYPESAEAPEIGVDLSDLLKGCKDALLFTGPIGSQRELVEAASKYHGTIGVNRDAWDRAVAMIGPVAAATTYMLVLQRHARPIKGVEPMRNPGGYFRSMTRMVKDGKVNLAVEIQKFKGRR